MNVANATQGGAGLNLAGTISVSSADAPLYFYSDFADPNAASINSNGVSGLNNFGQVVGTYQDASGLAHGFVYNGGNNYTEIDDSAGVHGTFAQGINDAGQVVGYYLDAGNTPHGFICDPSSGAYTEVDDSHSSNGSYLVSINNAGQAIGYYNAGFSSNYFLYDAQSKSTVELAVPSSFFTRAAALNNSGQVVGSFDDNNYPYSEHGFIYNSSTGHYTTFDDPNAGSGLYE